MINYLITKQGTILNELVRYFENQNTDSKLYDDNLLMKLLDAEECILAYKYFTWHIARYG